MDNPSRLAYIAQRSSGNVGSGDHRMIFTYSLGENG